VPRETQRVKLLWLIGCRAAVITLLLGTAILIQLKSPGAAPSDPLFLLIGVSYALTALYVVTLKFAERHRWVVDTQLAIDAVFVSAVVHLTGGVTSGYSTLYTLPIIAASAIDSRRGGMMVGLLSSILYTGLVLAEYFTPGFLPGLDYQSLPALRNAMFAVGLNVFGFVAVASLSGYLAEGLRRADEKLLQASNQIADLQAFSQYVINSLTSGLATTDIDGQVLTFNRAAEVITGMSVAHAVGRSVSDVLQLPPDVAAIFGPREARPRLPRVEVGFRRGDGSHIELGLSTASLMTPRGETGFLFTFQDVTQSRRNDREARVQQRLAAVGEMAAGIAHEIRNPLASMSGSIQILRQELPLTDDQAQLMDIVLRESDRLNETIGSFLAYARPQRLATTRVDIRQVITDTARLLQNNAELTESHEIRVDVPPGETWYEADQNQIRQVVWNLATNAVRAMPHGGQLRMSVAQHAPGAGIDGEVVIRVEDQGVGIAPDELDGIFQPFRGAFTRGTGLGLAIVHRIVSDYGGEVHVTSQRGIGTQVEVTLPQVSAARSDAPAVLN
jgi:two-component system, NtrC family, sensor histidine kinase PilS